MENRTSQTEYVESDGGRIAYDVIGDGPLVVLSPGVADIRSTYRFLAPLIADAGYRVASVDLRGHGRSSTGWDSYSYPDTAGDLIQVIRKLGGPAVIAGHSFSGGATTIAAATHSDLVSAIVEISPFTRPQNYSVPALLSNAHNYRRGGLLLARFGLTGSVKAWSEYLDVAYPGRKPADWDIYLGALQANLREPGRTEAAQKMFRSSATQKVAGARLADVRCPALLVMGRNDSDFPNPEAEAKAIVDLLPAGLGQYEMIDNAGHYPHAEWAQQVARAIVPFLAERCRA